MSASKTPHKDLCNQALKHYMRLQYECCSYNSVVFKAIEYYRDNKEEVLDVCKRCERIKGFHVPIKEHNEKGIICCFCHEAVEDKAEVYSLDIVTYGHRKCMKERFEEYFQ